MISNSDIALDLSELGEELIRSVKAVSDMTVVELFPDNPELYSYAKGQPTVLIKFDAVSFQDGTTTMAQTPIIQNATLDISAVVASETLQGVGGVYVIVKNVIRALSSLTPDGYTRIVPRRWGVEGRLDGFWEAVIRFETKTINILGEPC